MLAKTVDWLNQTTYIINKIICVEERTSKLAYIHERLQEQPHPTCIENLSISPDGEQGKPSEYTLGRAININTFIEANFPDGRIDFLFFGVNNDKADIMLDTIDPSVHTVGSYYFLIQKGYE